MKKNIQQNLPLQQLLCVFLVTIAFILALGGLTPLYHSNQNTHMLRGLVAGGLDTLANDWYANTQDPMPVFGFLVQITTKILPDWVFYIFQFILLAIYLYSSLGITDHFFNIRRSRLLYYSFLVIYLFTYTTLFSNLVGVNIYLGLAGQDLGLTQFLPNVFGCFLFLSLLLFLRKKYVWAVLSLCLAGYVHTGYVVAAALLTGSYMIILFFEERSLKKPLMLGLLALVVISPVIVYNLQANAMASKEQIYEATRIMVDERIPHHTRVDNWWKPYETVKLLLCLLAVFLMRKSRIFPLLLIGFLITFLPVGILMLRPSNLVSLFQPWRASVLLVPLCSTLFLGFLISSFYNRYQITLEKKPVYLIVGIAALAAFILVYGSLNQFRMFKIVAEAPTNQLYAFIQDNSDDETVYLIPPRDLTFQGFRLSTKTPLFVDWKSHPWNTLEVLEWYRRIAIADAFYANEGSNACQSLPSLVTTYHITNVLSYHTLPLDCPGLEIIFQDPDYVIYQIAED